MPRVIEGIRPYALYQVPVVGARIFRNSMGERPTVATKRTPTLMDKVRREVTNATRGAADDEVSCASCAPAGGGGRTRAAP